MSDEKYCILFGISKVRPVSFHEGIEKQQSYSSTISLTSTLDGVRGQCHSPSVLLLRDRPGTNSRGQCGGPRAMGEESLFLHRGSIPGITNT